MSGFGSLFYTDCVPGQGLQGGAGFQFQAATPGPAAEAMHVVQRSALYEPPAAWMRDRRPVEAYPLSLAHTAEEGFLATAVGRYLGQEANGTREGNQFTHAIVTSRPADYGSVRPAQLWAADWWARGPAPGTTLDELPPDPLPGPLDIEAVRDRVAATAGGDATLAALVSSLQHVTDPARRRTVVLVTADPERAACWLAAATLLLPSAQALRISFKIFVTDPQYARHEVVALHPEWAGRWADTAPDSGLAVFDLDEGRRSDVETTPAAAFWVPRFLGDDAYDVVDAVERAGEFALARARRAREAPAPAPAPDGAAPVAQPAVAQPAVAQPAAAQPAVPEPTHADRLVAVVDAAGEPLRDPDDVVQVARWLQTAPEEAVRFARDAALDAVLVTGPSGDVLRTMAEAVGERGWDDAAVHRVLGGLLDSELVEAERGDGPAALRGVLGRPRLRIPRRTEDDEAARTQVESALRAARPDQVPALLAVAGRHDVRPRTSTFRATADAFARWWLDQTDDELMPRRWDAPPEAVDWVSDVLRGRLDGGGAEAQHAVAAVRDRWWEPLRATATDVAEPLHRLVLASVLDRLPADQAGPFRGRIIELCAACWPGVDGGRAAWDILSSYGPPTLPASRAFVAELERRTVPMAPEIARALVRRVDEQRELSRDGLWLVRAVGRHGHPLPPNLVEQRAHDRAVRDAVGRLRAQDPTPEKLAATLAGVPAQHCLVRLPDLVEGLLGAPPDRAAAVLRAVDRSLLMEVCPQLVGRWPSPGRPIPPRGAQAAALVFVLTADATSTAQTQDLAVLRTQLGQRVLVLDKDKEERAAIVAALPRGWRDPWAQWLRGLEPNLLRRLGKVAGGRRGESGKREG